MDIPLRSLTRWEGSRLAINWSAVNASVRQKAACVPAGVQFREPQPSFPRRSRLEPCLVRAWASCASEDLLLSGAGCGSCRVRPPGLAAWMVRLGPGAGSTSEAAPGQVAKRAKSLPTDFRRARISKTAMACR